VIASLRRFADRSPAAFGVVNGLGTGVFFGVIMGVTNHSARVGLFEGLFFGTLMAVFFAVMARRRWPASFTALGIDQRQRVRTAVLKGDAVDDPALAPAVIDYATRVEQAQARGWSLPLLGIVCGAGTAWLAVDAFRHHDTGSGLLWAVAVCFWLLVGFGLPLLRARSLDRAARAKAAARSLLGEN
jgi:hypothetical protein